MNEFCNSVQLINHLIHYCERKRPTGIYLKKAEYIYLYVCFVANLDPDHCHVWIYLQNTMLNNDVNKYIGLIWRQADISVCLDEITWLDAKIATVDGKEGQ